MTIVKKVVLTEEERKSLEIALKLIDELASVENGDLVETFDNLINYMVDYDYGHGFKVPEELNLRY